MAQPVIQHSFVSGELAPTLYARVDLTKYHSAAALLRNFTIDYRGGASTRPGLRYVNRSLSNGGNNVRLIPFQASQNVAYVLEFGNTYIRFFSGGAPIVEAATTITGITNVNPGVITDTAHGYSNGQWVLITGVGGMTQLNGNYFIVANVTANTYTLQYLDGTNVDTTTFGVYTSGGTAQRVYTISTPYPQNEVFQLKFTQNVNTMIICHPNHPPMQLVLNTATNWTISAITIGATIAAPGGIGSGSSLGAGTVNYAYVVTAVDANGQESAPSAFATLSNLTDIRSNPGTNTVTWTAVAAAVSYNIYRAQPTYSNPVPAGASFGFVGNQTGLKFNDSNITPNFALGPPIILNPFSGSGVQSVTVTNAGNYIGSIVPNVTFSASPGNTATGYATCQALTVAVNSSGVSYAVNDLITTLYGIILHVDAVDSHGAILAVSILSAGNATSGTVINANPYGYLSTTGSGQNATFNLTIGVASVSVTSPGTGYLSAPTVTFSNGAATATATLGAAGAGNPAVPAIFQQRLVLAGPVGSPQQFNMSQTGSYYNFNINNPLEASDAIQGTISTTQLANIQSMLPQPYGLIVFADKGAWLINGGSAGSAVSPLALVANAQIYNGANYIPPIVANDNILYIQSKGSIVRNLIFNYYTQIYTGSDISVLSSHLFYNFQILDWAYAEEPYKLVWAVRNDGIMLSLTFLREQELIAWAHHDTVGSFKSVCTVTELTQYGYVDAVYVVVQRPINGIPVIYIERFVEYTFPQGRISSKQMDASLSYSGPATTTFSGARHLAGATVTCVADGVVIPTFTMPSNGIFILPNAAANVTVGLPFLPQLQTLPLDLGEPTVQGKRKKITAVTVRVKDALGLQIGRNFTAASQKNMKDLVIGNVGTMTNQLVTDLVTGDARTIVDPLWDVPGQYAIQQPLPYPATILGVIPEIEVGDTPK